MSRSMMCGLLAGVALGCAEPPTGVGTGDETGTSPALAAGKPNRTIVKVDLGMSVATDVDEQGRVVGSAVIGRPFGSERGMLWEPASSRGTTGALRELPLYGGRSEAYGMNDLREIVGGGYDAAGIHAVYWAGGSVRALGEPAGITQSFAGDISEPRADGSRLVVGSAGAQPAVWRLTGQASGLQVTVTLLAGTGEATDVNASGLIVGGGAWKWTPSGSGWTPTALQRPPGDTYAQAMAVNASGTIAGYSNGTIQRAVVWPAGSLTPVALPLPAGSTGATAWAINDAGQVGGTVYGNRGQNSAALWTPRASGGYNAPLILGGGFGYGLNEPLAESGVTYVEVVGWPGVLWKVRL